MAKPKPLKTDFRGHDRWLTFALILGPAAALSNLFVSFALVPESCARGAKTILHLTAAGFFLACLAGAALAWRTANRFVEQDPNLLHERTRWLAMAGAVLCASSALLIAAMEIPNLILRSCD